MLELIPSAFLTGFSLITAALLGEDKTEDDTEKPCTFVSAQNAAFSLESLCKDSGVNIDTLNAIEKKLSVIRNSNATAAGYDWQFKKQGDNVIASKMYEY